MNDMLVTYYGISRDVEYGVDGIRRTDRARQRI